MASDEVVEKSRFSDDSDFDLDSSGESDDSEWDDEDLTRQLSNTMLLSGPHGVGKTALVYALAEQLGYKVCFNH